MFGNREKARVLDRLFDFSEDAFLVVDAQGRIVDINNTYYNLILLSKYKTKEEIIGMPVQEVFYNSRLPSLLHDQPEVAVMDSFYAGRSTALDEIAAGFHLRTCANIHDQDGRLLGAIAHVRFNKQAGIMEEMLNHAMQETAFYKTKLTKLTNEAYSCEEIIGITPAIMKTKNELVRAAATDFNVMITGETGTGKELFASALHNSGSRRAKPFIKLNCSAIPDELFESELFGYEEGAFTGARKGGKKGKFELANGGTIFLDEIADMPMQMQVKLLRVLQEHEVDRIGSSKAIKIDVRVIAATNKDLRQSILEKTFRADLYYRLNVISIHIPPLRDRREDIPSLANSFLESLNERYGTDKRLSPAAMTALKTRPWHGNVRELKNAVERMFAFSDAELIPPPDELPEALSEAGPLARPDQEVADLPLAERVEQFERALIVEALERTGYNFKRAAAALSMNRGTLYNKIEKYRIRRPASGEHTGWGGAESAGRGDGAG